VTGFVLHPGHHELHGITVVVETVGPLTYVARFDTADERGVHLLNVATHDRGAPGPALDEFLARTKKFGVKAAQKYLLIPQEQVRSIRRLTEISQPS
jgi:hypothetical protein